MAHRRALPCVPVNVDVTTRTAEDLATENERLRARVAGLEDELSQQSARTNAIRAQAQERVYWLDRWNLDLNALMRKPGAAQVRRLMRAVRWPMRQATQLKRRLLG